MNFLLLLVGLVGSGILPACTDRATQSMVIEQWVGTGKTRILVDSIHQLEGIPDAVWDETEFRYAHSQSSNRLLANLLPHNFRFRQIKDGWLSYDLLKVHDILYLGVPTAVASGSSKTDREMPRLRPDEVRAISRYLKEGGSALVIGEHNNAYDNVEVLRPLLQPLGIELAAAYASEPGRGRFAMDVGGYMLMVRHFKKHPVTEHVRMISLSGSAPFTLKSKGPIAFLSSRGFIDLGDNISKKPSRASNHRVDEGEYQGPNIPIAVAIEVGRGRLIALGDHNIFGTSWLGVGDNYAFGMNAMQWLARREGEKPFRDAKPIGLRFGIEQELSAWTIGRRDTDG